MKKLIVKIYLGLKHKRRHEQFFILISFLVTFAFARVVAHLQNQGIIPSQQGYPHIHHLVFGIFFIILSNYLAISFWNSENVRLATAALFGVGAALTIDEFALWLYLDDVYWEREGRYSIDAIIITGAIFLIVYLLGEAYDHWKSKKSLGQGPPTSN